MEYQRPAGDAQQAPEAARAGYKRPFDLAVLSVAHVVLLPLWVVLWTLVPLLVLLFEGRPILYRQRRVGLDGRVITIAKFRTMRRGADKTGPSWTLPGDKRVTRLGRLLRKTGLDELPQVLSIWKGDLSLVGPRALDVDEQRVIEQRLPAFRERLRVRPGFTGFAQVFDRTDDCEAKLVYDLEYIRRMSPRLDLYLLLRSAGNTLLARWDSRSGKANLPVDPG